MTGLRSLERGVRRGAYTVVLERVAAAGVGDHVLVMRAGVPAVEPWPIADDGQRGVWVVGVLRVRAEGR